MATKEWHSQEGCLNNCVSGNLHVDAKHN